MTKAGDFTHRLLSWNELKATLEIWRSKTMLGGLWFLLVAQYSSFFWAVHCEMKEELRKRGRDDVLITEYDGLHHEWEVWDRAVREFIDECDYETIGAGFRY